MTSQKRTAITLSPKEPDSVPIDTGGSIYAQSPVVGYHKVLEPLLIEGRMSTFLLALHRNRYLSPDPLQQDENPFLGRKLALGGLTSEADQCAHPLARSAIGVRPTLRVPHSWFTLFEYCTVYLWLGVEQGLRP
jgi:hypothetical protein